MKVRTPIWLSALTLLSIFLVSCGPSNEATIATSVALTVQAQNATNPTGTASPIPTATLPFGITPVATLTNIVPTVGPTSAGGNTYYDCAKASLVSENPPDGALMAPENSFTKTWQIKNESACWWTTEYKIIFWDGNVLGGSYIYNLPQGVGPGQSVSVSIFLVAPKENGAYRGEWKLQTPDGYNFGVGQYNAAIYADIVVDSNIKKDEPQITKVTYRLVRDPAAGCATNVLYTVYATLETNGPIDVRIQWLHSDGYTSKKIRITLKEAGTIELIPEKGVGGWMFHLGDSPGDKWMQLWQVEPTKVEFDKVNFSYLCGAN